MQEPSHKLRLFSSKLLRHSKDLVDDSTKFSFERIDAAAQSMQNLINDVVTYHNISNTHLKKESINLNTIITDITKIYFANNVIKLFVGALPKVEGDKAQLTLVIKTFNRKCNKLC